MKLRATVLALAVYWIWVMLAMGVNHIACYIDCHYKPLVGDMVSALYPFSFTAVIALIVWILKPWEWDI